RRQVLGVDRGGLGEGVASGIVVVLFLKDGAQAKPGALIRRIELHCGFIMFAGVDQFALLLSLEAFLVSFAGIVRRFVGSSAQGRAFDLSRALDDNCT